MTKTEARFKIPTPLGDFSVSREISGDSYFLQEGTDKLDDLQITLFSEKIASPNPPKADQADEVYLIQFSFKALKNIDDMMLLFDFENRKYSDIGYSDSGEHFESVGWENNDYSAHLGFRTALDEGYNFDGFDLLEVKFPEKNLKELKLVFPLMKKDDTIEFVASFAWTKKKHKEDCATVLAADYALPPLSK